MSLDHRRATLIATSSRPRSRTVSLLLACHPVPTVAVTAMGTALTAAAGNGAWTTAVAGAAVLTGQLSIGWSNDALDAERDAASGRHDKPVATGEVSPRLVRLAAGAAAGAALALSLLLGWAAAAASMLVVASGWAYNAGLKSTVLSWLPFAVAFGALPALGPLALADPRWPPPWAVLAGALVGVAAHLGNVLPDLGDDAATGVRGLPHQLGRFGTATAGVGCAVAACLAVALGPGQPSGPTLLVVAAAVVISLAGLYGVRRDARSEAAFYASMAVAALGVVLLATSPAYP